MNELLILQGVPASGKSTFARQFVKDNEGWVIVNRDTIRKGFGNDYKINNVSEKYVTLCELNEVCNALDCGFNVIIDATNLNPNTLKKWNNLANIRNLDVKTKEFVVSFDEAVERDSKRENPVGEKVIKKFFRMYYPDKLKEESTQTIVRPRVERDPNLPDAVICDLDGTLAWMNNRSPYDYTKVYDDKFDQNLRDLLNHLRHDYKIIFVSGREDSCREDTIRWLNNVAEIETDYELYMRKTHDYRPDEIVKEEIYHSFIEGNYNVTCVFDDRDKVVNMWRNKLGLFCCQVWVGNF